MYNAWGGGSLYFAVPLSSVGHLQAFAMISSRRAHSAMLRNQKYAHDSPIFRSSQVELRIRRNTETLEGPSGVGTTYLQAWSVPKRSEESFEVAELERDRALAIHGGLGPFVGTLTYDFAVQRFATTLNRVPVCLTQ